jgi:hypothetical protein
MGVKGDRNSRQQSQQELGETPGKLNKTLFIHMDIRCCFKSIVVNQKYIT